MKAPPKIGSRDHARAALWMNLAVPGLGLWMVGRHVTGALCIAVSFSGLSLQVVWLVWFFRRWIAQGAMPDPLTSRLWVPLLGLVLFAGALLAAMVLAWAHWLTLPPDRTLPPRVAGPT